MAARNSVTGTPLARVADQGHLKAQLKIPETQAKDVAMGQKAEVDIASGKSWLEAK